MDGAIHGVFSNNLQNLDHQPQEQVATDASLEMESELSLQDSEQAATWTFCALVRGAEWDPSLFTSVLNECRSKFGPTLDISTIFSCSCRDRNTVVPAGYVAVEGYLKLKAGLQVKRGTLRRRFKHPDLKITWTACRVGRDRRYTEHDFISRFHRETALPPAGVLQPSTDAVGLRLRVDYLGPSDVPLNRGGCQWAAPGRKERQAAADAGAAGAGAPAGAPQAAPAPSPAAAA